MVLDTRRRLRVNVSEELALEALGCASPPRFTLEPPRRPGNVSTPMSKR